MHMDSMDMDMPTSTGMPMATSTSDSSMHGSMDMDMTMETMKMVFFTSTTTPLWSSAFSPKNTGQYAGVCVFLIAFALAFRFLLALRANFFSIVTVVKQRRSGGLIPPNVSELKPSGRAPWRADEAVMLAAVDVVIAGVSYLLMLAVMTMNVGYFLSVLAGVFVGSLLCGRFIGGAETH